jgi:hypothetical protein
MAAGALPPVPLGVPEEPVSLVGEALTTAQELIPA